MSNQNRNIPYSNEKNTSKVFDLNELGKISFGQLEGEKDSKLKNLELLKQNDLKLYSIIKPIYDSIYKRGVIESIDTALYRKPIFLADGNFAEAGIYFDYFTIKTAADFIENEINKNNAVALKSVNYLDYLTINFYFNKDKTNFFIYVF